MQDDSDDDGRGNYLVLWHQVRKRWKTDQVPESDLHPVPEDDDLNAAVIEVMTDVEVLFDRSSVVDVFAVNCARRKRVEVSERKMTERSWSFNRGLFTECLIWSRKSLLIKRESCARGGS